ncbi:MAG: hypothetical protein IIB59_04515 [Planctomycetes bacterium]|nr:hypothetical protein [Planctomycetota bacterium]
MAFTLIEVLVVVGMIGLLLAILLPSLSAARAQARVVACRSNIRQITAANGLYADEHGGTYCPGASDFLSNLHRWHGSRSVVSEAFDSARGPLASFLGVDGSIRQCPSFPADEVAKESGGFERGNGGYGYNNAYVGVQLVSASPFAGVSPSAGESVAKSRGQVVATDRRGVRRHRIKRPSETLMFADTAFATDGLIEYSFAEPRFHPQYPTSRAAPSIHFRHGVGLRKSGQANVGWCDGHVDGREMTFSYASPFYRAKPERFGIGWFGTSDDNRFFDLR